MTLSKFAKFTAVTLPILGALGGAIYWLDGRFERVRETARSEVTQEWQRRIDDTHSFNERTLNDAIERSKIEREAALREKDLTTSKQISDTKLLMEMQQTKFNELVESLREQLAAARNSVQIREGQVYLSLNDLRITRSDGVRLLGAGKYLNFKNLLIPDYTKLGWSVTEGISAKQLVDINKKDGAEIHLQPDEVDPQDPNWWPLGVLFTKEQKDGSAKVGVILIERERLTKIVKIFYPDEEIPASLTTLPLGILAQIMTTRFVFDKAAFTLKTNIEEFSARKDAYYLCLRSAENDKTIWSEVVAFEEGNTVILAVSECTTSNALNPILEESRRWIKELRVVKD